MLRYTTDRARPGLVAFYDIRPGNGAGQFLQPHNPHGADKPWSLYMALFEQLIHNVLLEGSPISETNASATLSE